MLVYFDMYYDADYLSYMEVFITMEKYEILAAFMGFAFLIIIILIVLLLISLFVF